MILDRRPTAAAGTWWSVLEHDSGDADFEPSPPPTAH